MSDLSSLSDKQLRRAVEIASADGSLDISVLHSALEGERDRLMSALAELGGEEVPVNPSQVGRRRSKSKSGKSIAAAESSAAATTAPAKRKKSKRRVTPEQRASRQLQGRYLGAIRRVPEAKRAQYKKIAQTDRAKAITAINAAYPPKGK